MKMSCLDLSGTIRKGGKKLRTKYGFYFLFQPLIFFSYLTQLGYSSLHFALDAKTAEFLISAGASLEAVDKVKIIQQFWYYFLLLHISGDVHLFFAPFGTEHQPSWLFSLSMVATFLQKTKFVLIKL